MISNTFTLAAAALLGLTHAVPVDLPASQSTQQDIINLQQTITNLANDIVQTNVDGAKSDYASADSQFKTIGGIVTSSACPPITAQGRVTNGTVAIEFLRTAQSDLSQLSLDLQNTASSASNITGDYCNAYDNLLLIDYYVTDVLGQPENGASNYAVAQELNSQGYDPNKLGQTYQANLVAAEALISALNNIPSGQPATQDAKDAYISLKNAISTFGKAANPGIGSCPLDTLAGATDPKSAINYVYGIEKAVQKAYADTTAASGTAHGDFCVIQADLRAVESYVKA